MAEEYLYGKYDRSRCRGRRGSAISRRTRILTCRRPFKREGGALAETPAGPSAIAIADPHRVSAVGVPRVFAGVFSPRVPSLAVKYDLWKTSVSRNHPRGTERERGMGPGAQERRLGRHGPAHRRRSEAHYKNGECSTFRRDNGNVVVASASASEFFLRLAILPLSRGRLAARYVISMSISVHPALSFSAW